ncbi:ribonuclease ZC3H12A-like [Acyrthosiphon pisum]|uniref:RNase NYN domain-containing protein n=1 Tax=Acyrthosiphon pisum TaxID=7029 RepID=A0A8R2JQ52_ACYPI|nr:ribonuclease ZC3H12A-like [Acyrthosiphon pisum]|eukprot:XP_016663082.1 PREDICTED: ribonuclease ZC3H12A-like isoform X2 [Acyrthosiphon pisum]
MTNNNCGTVQNNGEIVRQVNNYSEIPNEYIEFGVEPNNNTIHQQSNQFVQYAGQPLQHNQLSQSLVNYIHQEPANYSQKMTPPITTSADIERRRPIIIDGLNIGYSHGSHKKFSAKGMLICAQFFIQKGFKSVKIVIPQHRRGKPGTETHSIINMLIDEGYIYFTPSRKIRNIRLTCYSDRVILDYAMKCGGVVVSNDNFRDLYGEYREIIETRHIMFMFIDDIIIFPNDQYGYNLPHLFAPNILHFPA